MINRFKHSLSTDEMAGLLTEISSDILKTEKNEVTSRWFRAGDDLELFAWLNHQKQLIRFQVVVFDQVVEWDLLQGLRTGFVEDAPPTLKAQKPSSLVIYDTKINQPTVDLVKRIVESSVRMEELLKKKIIDTVLDPKKLEDISLFQMLKNLFR